MSDAVPSAEEHRGAPVASAPQRHVVFSHGQASGPWGRKITALAEVARGEGYEVHSVDYRGLDAPRERIARLAEYCKELSGELVLAGSSLGGYVTVASASVLHARGVFLMAPALYFPDLRMMGSHSFMTLMPAPSALRKALTECAGGHASSSMF